jgi:hypothetical protein
MEQVIPVSKATGDKISRWLDVTNPWSHGSLRRLRTIISLFGKTSNQPYARPHAPHSRIV